MDWHRIERGDYVQPAQFVGPNIRLTYTVRLMAAVFVDTYIFKARLFKTHTK